MPKTSVSATSNRAVFVAPPEQDADARYVLTPGLLMEGLWKGRRLGALIIVAFIGMAMLYIAFFRHLPYVATAVIEPPINAGPQISGASQVLASFAGLEASGSSAQFTKYLQVIGSSRFAERMDRDHNLLHTMNEGWDEKTHSWTRPSGPITDFKARLKAMLGMQPWTPPDINSLAESLQSMTSITLVPGKSPMDLRSQVFSVSVRAKSPQMAYNLLSWTLRATDDLVREDQLARTTNRIAYLKAQIDSTQEVYLRSSLQQILMSQEETLMTLHADKFFAIDLVDRPSVSDKPVGTSVPTLLMLAAFLGFALYGLIIAILLFRRVRSAKPADSLRAPYPDPLGSVFGRLRMAFQ